jgi:hypothetical protein
MFIMFDNDVTYMGSILRDPFEESVLATFRTLCGAELDNNPWEDAMDALPMRPAQKTGPWGSKNNEHRKLGK